MDDELMDLVNRSDNVIGTINRKDYATLLENDLGYIRSADLFLLNDKSEIYVPVRTAHKTIAPNGFDFSAGGHVGAGDDSFSTIIRETEEELNLVLNPAKIELIGKNISDESKYIQSLYLYKTNDTPTFNPDDFVSAEWMLPERLLEEIENGHPAKSNIKASITLLKEYLNKF